MKKNNLNFNTSDFCLFLVSFLFLLIIGGFGCSDHVTDPSHEIVKELSPSTVILDFHGGKVTASDVHDKIAPRLERLRDEMTNLYRSEAEELALLKILEARARTEGFKSAQEFKASLKSKIEIQDAEIVDFIKRNHLPPAAQKQEVKKFLQDQAWVQKEAELKISLLKEAALDWKISDATHEFKEKGALPLRGDAHPQVVIHEFCDFSNPLCLSVRVGMEQVLARYPKDVGVFFHPLYREDRPGSLSATLASICSAKQNKFWEMSGKLFDHQAKLSDATIDEIAKELGLEMKSFKACLAEPRTKVDAQDELAEAHARGVKETPALFVNGESMASVDELSERVKTLVEKNKN